MWEIAKAKHIAKEIGFQYFLPTTGMHSIQQAYKKQTKNSTGIYLQFRDDETLYIGQSVDIPRRYQSHIGRGVGIEAIAYITCQKDRLDMLESRFIIRAQKLGYDLANLAKENQTFDLRFASDFSRIVSFDEQKAFIERLHLPKQNPRDLTRFLQSADASHRVAYMQFQKLGKAPLIEEVAAHIVQTFIPQAMELAGHFWTVSLDSKKNDGAQRSALRLQMGRFTLVDIRYYKKCPSVPLISLGLATELLAMLPLDQLLREYPWVDLTFNYERAQRAESMDQNAVHIDLKQLSTLTAPVEMIKPILADPRLGKVFARTVLAAFRYAKPITTTHNNPIMSHVLTHRLFSRLWERVS